MPARPPTQWERIPAGCRIPPEPFFTPGLLLAVIFAIALAVVLD